MRGKMFEREGGICLLHCWLVCIPEHCMPAGKKLANDDIVGSGFKVQRVGTELKQLTVSVPLIRARFWVRYLGSFPERRRNMYRVTVT